MAGIRTTPPTKYVVQEQKATGDKQFGPHLKYENLLTAAGGTYKRYTDLTEFGKAYYSPMSETLSKDRAPFLEWVKGMSGGPTDVKTQFVRWRVYGQPKRKFLSLSNPNGATCTKIGLDGSKFKVIFDVNHFVPSDQLAPVENGRAVIIIESLPRKTSGGYEYEARLLRNDIWLTPSFLVGKFWNRAGQATSYLEPLSGRAGGFSFMDSFAYVEFQIPLSTHAKEMRVDREVHMAEGQLMVGCQYEDKLMHKGLIDRFQIEFEAQFEKDQENMLIFGEMTTHHVDPLSRRPITTSPGLYAYLEESNIIKYSPFVNSVDMIVDLIEAYWYDRVPFANRKLVLLTGEAGLKLWNNWLNEKFNSLPISIQHSFVLGSAEAWDKGKTGYSLGGFQFTKYEIPTFGSISVAHWPILDDTLADAKTMPGSIYTVRSHEFIALDWGVGKPTVKMITNNTNSRDLIVPGYYSPFGDVGLQNPYFKTVGKEELGDSYLIKKSRTFGLQISDANRILLFRPAV